MKPALSFLLLCCVACTPVVNDDDKADDDVDDGCVDVDVCVDRCGAAVDACDVEVDCGACRDDDTVDALLAEVDEAIGIWLARGYMQDIVTIDVFALYEGVEDRLRNTPGTDDVALLRGLWFALRTFRNGHAGVFRGDVACREVGGADVGSSAFGVCALPSGDGFVVVDGPGGERPAALAPGDVVVDVAFASGIGGASGSVVERILEQPLCGNAATNDEGAVDVAAQALFSVVRPGDVLTVRGLDGATREVVLADGDERAVVPCRFNNARPWIEATVRDDDVAVIRLTRFTLFPGEPGYVDAITNEDVQRFIDNMIDQVRVVLDALPSTVRGVVWDARGNIGGASPVGFAIAAGMPSRRDVSIARCTTRIEGSDPVDYFVGGPDYDLVDDDRLAFAAPAAVLIDGMAISAADYFARAVQLGTDTPLFGRPATGAYGGGGTSETLSTRPELIVGYDPYRCNDVDGAALETRPTRPDVLIEQDPVDASIGIDTVLEAAVVSVLATR